MKAGIWPVAIAGSLIIVSVSKAGYTHYWTWEQKPQPEVLKACIAELRTILSDQADLIAGLTGTGLPETAEMKVVYNGKKPLDHEPFIFPGVPGFNSCKTFHKPYDQVVTACLLVARDHFPPQVLSISSDGSWVEWSAGAELYERVFDRSATPPVGLAPSDPSLQWQSIAGKIVVIGLVAGLIWIVVRPRYQFIIAIKGNQVRVTTGHVTATFLRSIEELFRENVTTRASIKGLAAGRTTNLRFSRHVPEDIRQRIRNLLQLHG